MDLTIEHMTVSESNLKPSTHLLHVFIIFFRIDNFNHTAEYYISANVQLRFNVFAFVIAIINHNCIYVHWVTT